MPQTPRSTVVHTDLRPHFGYWERRAACGYGWIILANVLRFHRSISTWVRLREQPPGHLVLLPSPGAAGAVHRIDLPVLLTLGAECVASGKLKL